MKDKRQESNDCIKVFFFKKTPSAEKNVHTSIPNIKKKILHIFQHFQKNVLF